MFRRLARTLRNLLHRQTQDADLDAELASFETMLVDQHLADGASNTDAHRRAHLRVGSRDAVKEAVRDVRAGAMLEQAWRDFRQALRTLRRSPVFATFTLLTFALATGGVTLIVTLINAVLLAPLPYPGNDRLVTLSEKGVHEQGRGSLTAAPNFQDWERQDTLFQRMALYEYQGFNLSGDGDPEQVDGLRTTSGLFEVLGIPPALGRPLLKGDDSLASGKVVVLGYRLWQKRFAGDPGLIGRSIRLNGEPWTVVGVMPEAFLFPSRSQQVFVPIQLNAQDGSRGSHSFLAVARLKNGVPVAEADAEMHLIGDRLRGEYPGPDADETATAYPMREQWVDDTADMLGALLIAVILVLLIAAANVGGLMVARGQARQREMAARLALGGSRTRVLAQFAGEALILALGGALAGLAVASLLVRQLFKVFPENLLNLPFRDVTGISVDGLVVVIVLGAALIAGVLSGLSAAVAVLPRDLASALRDGAAHGGSSGRGHRLRSILVGMEIALAVVVLSAAGLLVNSMHRLHRVAPGLDPANVTLLRVALPQSDYYGPAERTSFCTDLKREVSGVPGVQSVSAVSHLPYSGSNAGRGFAIEGQPDPGTSHRPSASWGIACPGYFGTMKIPLLAGRDFSDADQPGSAMVVVFNHRAVEQYFAGQDPVGKRVKLDGLDSDAPWMTVIGVVGDVHHNGLQESVVPYMYAVYPQNAWPQMSVTVRSTPGAGSIEQGARAALRRVAPEQPVSSVRQMDEVMEQSLGDIRFPLFLFSAFAVVALLLAALGVFGVAAQAVLQRRRELGIRMALGARAGAVHRLILGQALLPVGLGMLIGLGGTIAAGRVIRGLLFGVSATDPLTILAGAGLLGTVALLASLWPARHATRVDPALVLRSDG